ncbi:hypothetical protein [Streptomyces goshikiensis]|uniref:hypothetical protein n=1 Tax=Streptomyces goshikiensis TaxID=1942 RepID=UPI0036615274
MNGNEQFWSVHASSLGGASNRNNADNLLSAAASLSSGREWMVLGDFNRPPDRVVRPAGSMLHRPNVPTQHSGYEIDYMVSHGASQPLPASRIEYRGTLGAVSDHFPVELALNAHGSKKEDTGGDPPIISAKDFTKCITRRQETVSLMPCDGTSAQDWVLDGQHLRNTSSASPTECLGYNLPANVLKIIKCLELLTLQVVKPIANTSSDAGEWEHRENGQIRIAGGTKCIDIGDGNRIVLNECREGSALPESQVWHFRGVSAHVVAVTKNKNVMVTEMMPSGLTRETADLGGSFIKAVMTSGNLGTQILALDANGYVKRKVMNGTTGEWGKNWSQFNFNMKDFSVSDGYGGMHFAAVTLAGNIYLAGPSESGSDVSFVPLMTRGKWDRIASVYVPEYAHSEEGESAVVGKFVLFAYTPGGKTLLQKTIPVKSGNVLGGSTEIAVEGVENIESVTVNVGNSQGDPVINLVYGSTNSHVYATTMDLASGKWSGRHVDLGAVGLINLTSTEGHGLLVVCGTSKDNEPAAKCTQRSTFISAASPAKWTAFVGSQASPEEVGVMAGYVTRGVRVLSKPPAIYASLHLR